MIAVAYAVQLLGYLGIVAGFLILIRAGGRA